MKYIAFIACLFFSVQMCAQRYVLFNPSCTERFKYNNQYGEEHIVYAIQLGTTERIFLEIGEEAKTYKARISGALISCNNPSLSRNIVDQINGNVGTTFFMVRKEGKGKYLVSPIKAASYFNYDSGSIEYASTDYAIEYNMRNSQRNTNLNTLSTATQVFFVGTTNYDCRKGYTFSVSDRNGSLSDLTILPEIGVVDNVAFNTKRRLSTINATNFVDYLSAVCNGNTIYTDPSLAGISQGEIDFENDFQNTNGNYRPTSVSVPSTNTNTSVDNGVYREPATRPSYRPTTTATANTNTNTTNRSTTYTPRVHYPDRIIRESGDYNTERRLATDVSYTPTTQRASQPAVDTRQPDVYRSRGTDRTLPVYQTDNYRLPPVGKSNRNYGAVYVQTTNGNIHIVKKRETAYSIAKAYGITLTQLGSWNNLQDFLLQPGQQLVVRGTGGFTDRGVGTNVTSQASVTTNIPVVRRSTEPSAPNNRYGTPAWQSTNGLHTVKSGETFTSIAKMYGYTLDRFLDLNGLSKSTTIYPGQKLQTTDCSARYDEVDHRPNSTRTNHFEFDDEFNEKGASTASSTKTNQVPAPYFSAQSRFIGTSDPRQSLQKHSVRDREDLYTIARQYNTTVERLKYLNNMEVVEALLPGQIIFIQ